MDFKEIKNQGKRCTVINNCGTFYFYDSFFGLVAIAKNKDLQSYDNVIFDLEYCEQIGTDVIRRFLNKYFGQKVEIVISKYYHLHDNLPYCLAIQHI